MNKYNFRESKVLVAQNSFCGAACPELAEGQGAVKLSPLCADHRLKPVPPNPCGAMRRLPSFYLEAHDRLVREEKNGKDFPSYPPLYLKGGASGAKGGLPL